MKRIFVLLFGVGSYLCFLGVFLYAIGFIGKFAVPTSLDGPARGSVGIAAVTNLLLLGIFALQHSVMARPWFKRWWTQYVPQPMERSMYVLCSSVALALFFVFWKPMGGIIWDVQTPWARVALYSLFALGWIIVLVTTCLINHFDLFGLRQVWFYFRGQSYVPLKFVTPGPYQFVRHPLYVGWITVFWATPTMTAAHLLFAMGTTAYILIAIYFEERDLVEIHGAEYVNYRQQVPMLIPGRSSRSGNRVSLNEA